MNNEDHLSAVGNQNASDEMTARPDDFSSVHTSLAGIEEDDNFAEVVNGWYREGVLLLKPLKVF